MNAPLELPSPLAEPCFGDCDPVPTIPRRCMRCGWIVLRPQAGPQQAFRECEADIALFGGARGPGKTWSLVFEAGAHVHLPGYKAILFRRVSPDLEGLLDRSKEIYPHLGGVGRLSAPIEWRFPSGAKVLFRHLQHEQDWQSHQGQEYALIGFDELTQFTERQFWDLWGSNRTTCGIPARVRATCNPDAGSWVREYVDWWIGPDGYPIPERSGVLRWFVRHEEKMVWADTREELATRFPDRPPISFTFIKADLDDNEVLTANDPGYRGKLQARDRVTRERWLKGNWNVSEVKGSLFKRSWFELVDRPPERAVATLRFWDKAASEPSPAYPDPDWTRGARVSLLDDGRLCIEHMESLRATPGRVDARILATAKQDGRSTIVGLWQDPGQAGVKDVESTSKMLRGAGYLSEVVRAEKNKVAYLKIWSALAEPRDEDLYGKILVVRGAWNEAFFQEIEGLPGGDHDDQGDAVSGAALVLTDRKRLYQLRLLRLGQRGKKRP